MGLDCSLPRGVALGMIREIANAGFAPPRWFHQMLKSLNDDKVDPNVFEFYTVGDCTLSQETQPFISNRSNPSIDDFQVYVKSSLDKVQIEDAQQCEPNQHTMHRATVAREPNEPFKESADFSSMMDQTTLQWSWGMKFLFQAFAVRESAPNEWCLWPFAQPDFNNRHVELNRMWNEDDNKETLMSMILSKEETNFESQPVCSVPHVACTGANGGVPLIAMVEGTESDPSLVFEGLRAHKCTLDEMKKCFKAIMVGFLFSFSGTSRIFSLTN
jgi:hypothetical protein